MRRMSPTEVWRQGYSQLRPISPELAALILGPQGGIERVTRNSMIELRDSEISGDVLRFDAHQLPDREKYLTVLNPFAPGKLTLFDARGKYVSTLDRLHSVSRDDVEAVQRACGAAAKIEGKLLAPLRQRHMQEARDKTSMHRNNANVLDLSKPFTPEEKQTARDTRSRINGERGEFEDLMPETLEPSPASETSAEEMDISDLL
jgi:hypothetical protein